MREYGVHKSYRDYQKDALCRARYNLSQVEYGSDRYYIIKDHITRLKVQMSTKFREESLKYTSNSIEAPNLEIHD